MLKEKIKTNRRPQLKQIMKYKNPEIVARFCRDLGVSKEVGDQIFKDMLGFLYLCGAYLYYSQQKAEGKKLKRQVPREFPLLKEMLIIDEMWHTFVLYTVEYEAFSMKYFGRFMHHIPTPTLKLKKVKIDHFSKQDFESYLEFVWDELGEDFVDRWFTKFPRVYSMKKIRSLQLKVAEAA